jgi:glycine/D-amino acid oxidase-like deaminating enzyme
MAAELFVALKGMIRFGDALTPEFHVLGHRPIPKDGFPAVGRVDGVGGLYVAVTHSGITLAPAIGRFVADEIVTGRRKALLEPFGLARFSRATAARGSTISPLVEIRDMDGRRS